MIFCVYFEGGQTVVIKDLYNLELHLHFSHDLRCHDNKTPLCYLLNIHEAFHVERRFCFVYSALKLATSPGIGGHLCPFLLTASPNRRRQVLPLLDIWCWAGGKKQIFAFLHMIWEISGDMLDVLGPRERIK